MRGCLLSAGLLLASANKMMPGYKPMPLTGGKTAPNGITHGKPAPITHGKPAPATHGRKPAPGHNLKGEIDIELLFQFERFQLDFEWELEWHTDPEDHDDNEDNEDDDHVQVEFSFPPWEDVLAYDVDEDGKISYEEAMQYAADNFEDYDDEDVEEMFGKIDHNEDGFVTAMEYSKAKNRFQWHKLQQFDDNEDGMISMDEFFAAQQVYNPDFPHPEAALKFSMLDTSHDEQISKCEFIRCIGHWHYYKKFDEDKDHGISMREMQLALEDLIPHRYLEHFVRRVFPVMDVDGDRHVRKEEFEQGKRALLQPHPPRWDIVVLFDENEDGTINLEEFVRIAAGYGKEFDAELIEDIFNMLDRDGDGQISKEEYCPRHYVPPHRQMTWSHLSQFDANHDNQLDIEEFSAATELRDTSVVFNRLDLNGDGFLTEAEVTGTESERFEERFELKLLVFVLLFSFVVGLFALLGLWAVCVRRSSKPQNNVQHEEVKIVLSADLKTDLKTEVENGDENEADACMDTSKVGLLSPE